MRPIIILLLPAVLAACGSKDKADLAALDAQLTSNAADPAVDPAVKGAIESPILVDPRLARQSNALSVKPVDRPVDGQVPVLKGPQPNQAEVLKLVGGKLLHAPDAMAAKPCPQCKGARLTLGALARDSQRRNEGGAQAPRRPCNAKLAYGMEWAQRLPEPFMLYPGAKLMDAAGTDAGCAMRGVSFVANAPLSAVVDFYYTQARRAGFTASHELIDGVHALGGARGSDDGAFLLTFSTAPGDGTAVDMIGNNGR